MPGRFTRFNPFSATRSRSDPLSQPLLDGSPVSQPSNTNRDIVFLHACNVNDLDLAKQCLKEQPNLVNIVDANKMTPLHIASDKGHLEIVKLLIENEASVNQVTNDGRTPIYIACLNYNIKTVQMLFNAGANVKPGTIEELDYERDAKKFKLTVQNYIEYLNQIKELGKGDLCSALKNDSDSGSFELSEKFIKQNPYLVDIRIDSHGITPLMFVSEKLSEKPGSEKHFEDMFSFLIANKANLKAVDKKGETVLFKACAKGNTNLVNKLLEHGAKFDEDSDKIKELLSSTTPEIKNLINKHLPKSTEPGSAPRLLPTENPLTLCPSPPSHTPS
jgi:ankyrin repeat protein